MIPASKRKERDVSLPSLTTKNKEKENHGCLLADEKKKTEVHLPSSVVIMRSIACMHGKQRKGRIIFSALVWSGSHLIFSFFVWVM
jgi:hypothetical protein